MANEAFDDAEAMPPARRPPAFNAPRVVLVSIAALAAIQAVRSYALTPEADERLLADFAFIPACYTEDCADFLAQAGGALYWSPVSYALLHGDWMHLGLNIVWLLAFGTPIARRLGSLLFLAFGALGAIAGAGVFYVLNADLVAPMIGASGVVSALMGGACRFAFSPAGRSGRPSLSAPVLPVAEALGNRTIVVFIALFFATNLLTAAGFGGFADGGAAVAWQAHLGGFVFGFFAFPLFDRLRVTLAA